MMDSPRPGLLSSAPLSWMEQVAAALVVPRLSSSPRPPIINGALSLSLIPQPALPSSGWIKPRRLASILRQNVRRNLKHLVLSAFGIVVGIAAFVFFWALSEGVSRVVLRDIFPIDRVEVIAPHATLTGKTLPLGDDPIVATKLIKHAALCHEDTRWTVVIRA